MFVAITGMFAGGTAIRDVRSRHCRDVGLLSEAPRPRALLSKPGFGQHGEWTRAIIQWVLCVFYIKIYVRSRPTAENARAVEYLYISPCARPCVRALLGPRAPARWPPRGDGRREFIAPLGAQQNPVTSVWLDIVNEPCGLVAHRRCC